MVHTVPTSPAIRAVKSAYRTPTSRGLWRHTASVESDFKKYASENESTARVSVTNEPLFGLTDPPGPLIPHT